MFVELSKGKLLMSSRFYLTTNPNFGASYLLTDTDKQPIFAVKASLSHDFWNALFGWLVPLPETIAFTMNNQNIQIERRLRLMGGSYELLSGHQTFATIHKLPFQDPNDFQINLDCAQYTASFHNDYRYLLTINHDDQKIVAVRRDATDPNNTVYVVATTNDIDEEKGIALTIALLDAFRH